MDVVDDWMANGVPLARTSGNGVAASVAFGDLAMAFVCGVRKLVCVSAAWSVERGAWSVERACSVEMREAEAGRRWTIKSTQARRSSPLEFASLGTYTRQQRTH